MSRSRGAPGVLEAALKAVAERKHNGSHPGEVLRARYLIPARISSVQLAERMGVAWGELCEILRAEAPVGPPMAARLAIALDTTAAFWLELQRRHDRHRAALRALGSLPEGTGWMN